MSEYKYVIELAAKILATRYGQRTIADAEADELARAVIAMAKRLGEYKFAVTADARTIESMLVDALEVETDYQTLTAVWAAVTAVCNGLQARDTEIEKLRAAGELGAFKAFTYGVGVGVSAGPDALALHDSELARQLRSAFDEWWAKQ